MPENRLQVFNVMFCGFAVNYFHHLPLQYLLTLQHKFSLFMYITVVNITSSCGFPLLFPLPNQLVAFTTCHCKAKTIIVVTICYSSLHSSSLCTYMPLCLQAEGSPWPLYQTMCRGTGGIPPYYASLLPASSR